MTGNQYVLVRRDDLHSLIRHCSNCSLLTDNERNAVTSVETRGASTRGVSTPQKRPSKSKCNNTLKPTKYKITLSEANTWQTLQRDLGNRENYGNFIRSLTQRHTVKVEEEHGSPPTIVENEFVRLGVKLARLVKSSESVATTQGSFASLQNIVLRSYCKYLESKGLPRTEIINIMDVSCGEKVFLRQVDQVLVVNSTIAKLATLHNFDVPRGTELFAICILPELSSKPC